MRVQNVLQGVAAIREQVQLVAQMEVAAQEARHLAATEHVVALMQ